jgi:hypothetical protein
MEASCSSETSVDFQRTTRRYIPEDRAYKTVSESPLPVASRNEAPVKSVDSDGEFISCLLHQHACTAPQVGIPVETAELGC